MPLVAARTVFAAYGCVDTAGNHASGRPTVPAKIHSGYTARSVLTGGRATCTRQRRRVSYLGRNDMYAIRVNVARLVYSVHQADDDDVADNRVVIVNTLGELVDQCVFMAEVGYTRLNRVGVEEG